jgi:hypothetical protein
LAVLGFDVWPGRKTLEKLGKGSSRHVAQSKIKVGGRDAEQAVANPATRDPDVKTGEVLRTLEQQFAKKLLGGQQDHGMPWFRHGASLRTAAEWTGPW